MQAPVIPQTINRLFLTSLILSGMVIVTSIGTAYRSRIDVVITNIIFTLFSMAVMANHLFLYRIAGKQATPLSPSADRQTGYPNCLFGLPNIIFTALMAFIPLGFYWMPILSGIVYSSLPTSTSYTIPTSLGYTQYSYSYWERPALSKILQGVIGYAECGVLIALFAMYVRQRKVHLKAVREGTLKA